MKTEESAGGHQTLFPSRDTGHETNFNHDLADIQALDISVICCELLSLQLVYLTTTSMTSPNAQHHLNMRCLVVTISARSWLLNNLCQSPSGCRIELAKITVDSMSIQLVCNQVANHSVVKNCFSSVCSTSILHRTVS